MQGKMHPLELNGVVGFEFFNTHGTEITPGSDVVGENVNYYIFCHTFLLNSVGYNIYGCSLAQFLGKINRRFGGTCATCVQPLPASI